MVGRQMAAFLAALALFHGLSAHAGEQSKGEAIEEAKAKLLGTFSERTEGIQTLASQDVKDIQVYDILATLRKAFEEEGNPRVQEQYVGAFGTIAEKAEGGLKADTRKIIDGIMRDGNKHPVVRGRAVEALINLTDEKSYEGKQTIEYVEKLADDKSAETTLLNACYRFLGAKSKIIPDQLAKNLTSDDPTQRKAAISTFKNIMVRTKAALPGLIAAAIVKEIGNERANEEKRIDLLGLVAVALKTGSKIADAVETVNGVIKKSEKPRVRLAAVAVAAVALDEAMMKTLLQVYEDNKGKNEPDASALRRAACATAGEYFSAYGDKAVARYTDLPKMIDMCVEMLGNDPDGSACREAALSLGNLYSKEYNGAKKVLAIAALIEALGDKDKNVAEAAQNSLKFLTGEDLGATPEDWRPWFKKNEQKFK